jgi:nucleoside-diphosphate-sugar epimerase
MARVLVTGASGFIGFHLVKALVARGDDVTCFVRKTSSVGPLQSLGATLAFGDVTDSGSLRAPVAGKGVVYNMAGCTSAVRREGLYQVNEEGCRHVLQACAAQPNPPVVIHVSSLSAAGSSPQGRLRTEADPPQPVSDYGRSKRAGELAAGQFADRVPITLLRPAIVLGEMDRVGLAMFRTIARFGIHCVIGRTPRQFSVIHAADLAQLLILAAERGARLAPPAQQHDEASKSQGCYFAACDEHPTFGELGKLIGTALGRRFTLVAPIGLPMASVIAGVTEAATRICRRPFYFKLDKFREARAGAWTCSPEKARKELGFSPGAPLAERLRQTVEWYRREKWL